uniref:Uncharacterized protein LOC104246520 n=1 Tax=Nicotiana sylvestris TaxID=4096 RepID=A0A1U7YBY0_NICSY|nr:PREDICTED: uncharacterized protein LOC104246520 [Nicotiana sylvestris]
MLADSFVKAHARAIKVATRKSDLFKVRQKYNEMLREFISQFQMEHMDLPPITDDWAVQAFFQVLNKRSSVASRQLKQNLIEYPAVTYADVYDQYQSKIRVEDGRLGAPSGSVYPNRSEGKIQRDIDREPRSNRDRYQPYSADRRNNGPGHNPVRNDRGVVSAIGQIKDTRWPRPLQTDPAQRNPKQMCKYHGTHGHRTEDYRKLREEGHNKEKRTGRTAAYDSYDHRWDRYSSRPDIQMHQSDNHKGETYSELLTRGYLIFQQ